MSMTLSNNPVILMLLPDRIFYQEIKLMNNQGGPSKAKIQDMVAIRHPSGGEDAEDPIVTSIGAGTSAAEDVTDGSDEGLNEKTTMILLCDDGSLKIYVADQEKTEFWLQPHLKSSSGAGILQQYQQASSRSAMWLNGLLWNILPSTIAESVKATPKNLNETTSLSHPGVVAKPTTGSQLKRSNTIRSKGSSGGGGAGQTNKRSSTKQGQAVSAPSVTFPIDYFEKCTQLLDVEYSGSPDLLEIYNSQQLKLRLTINNSSLSSSSAGKFVVSTRPTGFRLDLINSHTDSANRLLLMGCRLLVGTSSLERVPQYVEILGRRVNIGKVPRARWIDVCLTRDEAFICDNKLSLLLGPSQQVDEKAASAITVLDGVMCYARSKTDLGYSKTEVASLQKKYNT